MKKAYIFLLYLVSISLPLYNMHSPLDYKIDDFPAYHFSYSLFRASQAKASCKTMLKHNIKQFSPQTRSFYLALACCFNHLAFATFILSANQDSFCSVLPNVCGPLHVACGFHREKFVELFIKNGANINESDETKLTPLHIAVQADKIAIVFMLLTHGAHTQCTLEQGETPLHIACTQNNLELVKLLVAHNAHLSAKTVLDHTILHCACIHGTRPLVQYILEQNSNLLNAADTAGYTPLHCACIRGNYDIIECLLKAGARTKVKTIDKETPLFIATQLNMPLIVSLLVKYGPPVNVRNKDGLAPIHIACINGFSDIVCMLINAGARLDIQTKHIPSPLNCAILYAHTDIIRLLINAHVDINLTSPSYFTPLQLAIKEQNIEAIKILLQNNAAFPSQEALHNFAQLHNCNKVVSYFNNQTIHQTTNRQKEQFQKPILKFSQNNQDKQREQFKENEEQPLQSRITKKNATAVIQQKKYQAIIDQSLQTSPASQLQQVAYTILRPHKINWPKSIQSNYSKQQEILNKIQELKSWPICELDIKKIKCSNNWRFRHGNMRIIFSVNNIKREIIIKSITVRKNTYKK